MMARFADALGDHANRQRAQGHRSEKGERVHAHHAPAHRVGHERLHERVGQVVDEDLRGADGSKQQQRQREPAGEGKNEQEQRKRNGAERQQPPLELEPPERRYRERRDERAGTPPRLEQPVGRRVTAENGDRPGRQQRHRADAKPADYPQQPDQRPDDRIADDVEERLLHVAADRPTARQQRLRLEPHGGERGDHGHERQPVDREAPAGAEDLVGHPGDGGPDGESRVEHRRVERDGVGQVPPLDQLRDERLARRGIEGVREPETGREHQDVPGAHQA
jgi:hypothetical protein